MGGTSRSTSFGCNIEAVQATAQQLDSVLDELRDFPRRDDEYSGQLASRKISGALDEFHKESSDQREKIKGSVEALARMLHGLADGVRQVDTALAGSLPDPEKAAAEAKAAAAAKEAAA